MTNEQLLERFARQYQAFHQLSPVRVRRQQRHLRAFAAQIAPRGLLDADGNDLTEYMGRQLDAGKSPNTVRFEANLIRPFYSWSYAAGLYPVKRYMSLRAADNPRGATGRSTPKPYTPEEVRLFYAELGECFKLPPTANIDRRIQRWLTGKTPFTPGLRRHAMHLQIKAIVALALHCGLRRGEIERAHVEEIHPDNLYMPVHGARKGGDARPRDRQVPHTRGSRKAVGEWLAFRALMRPDHNCPWLGVDAWGGDRTRPRTDLERLLLRHVGPSSWELHRFRHTFATERLRAGMEIQDLSKMLGHASLQQTLMYAEIAQQDVYRSLERSDDEFNRRLGLDDEDGAA